MYTTLEKEFSKSSLISKRNSFPLFNNWFDFVMNLLIMFKCNAKAKTKVVQIFVAFLENLNFHKIQSFAK